MAKFVLINASMRINAVDLSVYVSEVAVELSADDVETTAMGAGGHERVQGLRDDSFTVTAFSDFAAAKVDETVWPLFNGASSFLVEVWANGTTTAATNPKYSGTCILTEYQPISGSVGDAAMTPLTLPVNGKVSRATT